MCPLADFLLAFLSELFTVSDVSYIAESNHAHTKPHCLIHHQSTHLVLQVSYFICKVSSPFDFGSSQFMPTPRTLCTFGHRAA
jgi:hypothetical protein